MAQFSQEIQKCARKVGLSVNDVHIQYEAELDTGRRVPKTRLKLPPKGQYFQFIAQHVLPFFRRIQASSSNSDSLRLTADGADITVTFQRGKRFFGASYTPVTGIHALTNNVLWNALQLKAKKLKASGAPTAGIIVCDGGCDFLRANQIRPPSPSEADIFREFLRRTEWVAFVAVVGAEESAPNVFGGSTTHRINARWYVRSDARYEEIEKVVGRAVGLLPTPAFNTATAFLNQNGNGFGQGSMGYSSVSEKSIRISARSLQRLLAGELTVEGFEGAHRWRRELPNDPRPFPNPFSRKLRQGQLIERVDVERGPGDDDLVTFHFGEPDPALAPFRVRRSDDLAKKVRS
ncbi:hypothetical protein SAMN04488038_101281 [Solimonas aquatica]|uniref:Uncharacterized protein n=2 Tax=Solimonas aquatica TaxID=489703 RepID=A0A1H9A5J7_9GAMM|nr:hypothetical protein SAMN04488038_101281 [Solimonas aquatica]